MSTSMHSGPSLLAIELASVVVLVILALAFPTFGAPWFDAPEKWFRRLAHRRGLSVCAVGFAALLLRFALLPVSPIPQPFVHDEFSHLLAADTFSSGRLTNPTHPMWTYFESFHITHKPSYMSMYFPAQGIILAAGKLIAGHPWWGLWLSSGLMCATICWMLQAWLPPSWALLGGLLSILRLGLFSYWIDMYHGGTVPAIGGALVLGAFPRLMKRATVARGLALSTGVALLAYSRPYEGVLICVPVAWVLFRWLQNQQRVHLRAIAVRMIAPAMLLLMCGGFLAYYDHRVYGNAFTLPYDVNRATYAVAPHFVFNKVQPEPHYRYSVMRDFYVNGELADFLKAQTVSGFLARTVQKAGVIILFFFGGALLPAIALFPTMFRDRRIRFLLWTGAIFAGGLVVNAWIFPHYVAPYTAGLYALLIQAMRHLRCWRFRTDRAGLFLVRAMVVLCVFLAVLRAAAGPLHIEIGRWPTLLTWYGGAPAGLVRARIESDLASRPGPQLAIVRYAPGHWPFDEWVYNAANIDGAKVVWAREPDDRSVPADLLRYFSNRTVWLVQPDAAGVPVSLYSSDNRLHAALRE